MNKDLRIVFMGTPDFATSSLSGLVEAGMNVVGVFTKPDTMNTTANSKRHRLVSSSTDLLFILLAEAILYQSENSVVNHVHIIGIDTLRNLCHAVELFNLLCAAYLGKDKVGI